MSVAHKIEAFSRTGDVLISESVDFAGLLLSEPVLQGLLNSGFERPSPIQLKAIPLGRCGLDLIVQAKSGTGKTCVFSVVALEAVQLESSAIQVLVLAPTREIAIQIWDVVQGIGSAMPSLGCHTFIGGLPVHEDKQKLRKCHIAIGTPGRVKQLIENDLMRTMSIRLFVLDEADKLLEEGFQEQINWIYSSLPENKQMLALSATYPEYLAQHLKAYMRNPTFIRLNVSDPALLGIKQYFKTVPYNPMPKIAFDEKARAVVELLSEISFQQCLIFSNLQTRAQNLCEELQSQGWPTACIAGSHDQKDRIETMSKLKTFKCRILVSTDLTARGIDADKVNLIINLDVPKDHETYLHRIGRAGRFGTFGAAVTIVSTGQEEVELKAVEKKCNTHILPVPEPLPVDLVKLETGVTLNDIVSTEQIITRSDGTVEIIRSHDSQSDNQKNNGQSGELGTEEPNNELGTKEFTSHHLDQQVEKSHGEMEDLAGARETDSDVLPDQSSGSQNKECSVLTANNRSSDLDLSQGHNKIIPKSQLEKGAVVENYTVQQVVGDDDTSHEDQVKMDTSVNVKTISLLDPVDTVVVVSQNTDNKCEAMQVMSQSQETTDVVSARDVPILEVDILTAGGAVASAGVSNESAAVEVMSSHVMTEENPNDKLPYIAQIDASCFENTVSDVGLHSYSKPNSQLSVFVQGETYTNDDDDDKTLQVQFEGNKSVNKNLQFSLLPESDSTIDSHGVLITEQKFGKKIPQQSRSDSSVTTNNRSQENKFGNARRQNGKKSKNSSKNKQRSDTPNWRSHDKQKVPQSKDQVFQFVPELSSLGVCQGDSGGFDDKISRVSCDRDFSNDQEASNPANQSLKSDMMSELKIPTFAELINYKNLECPHSYSCAEQDCKTFTTDQSDIPNLHDLIQDKILSGKKLQSSEHLDKFVSDTLDEVHTELKWKSYKSTQEQIVPGDSKISETYKTDTDPKNVSSLTGREKLKPKLGRQSKLPKKTVLIIENQNTGQPSTPRTAEGTSQKFSSGFHDSEIFFKGSEVVSITTDLQQLHLSSIADGDTLSPLVEEMPRPKSRKGKISAGLDGHEFGRHARDDSQEIQRPKSQKGNVGAGLGDLNLEDDQESLSSSGGPDGYESDTSSSSSSDYDKEIFQNTYATEDIHLTGQERKQNYFNQATQKYEYPYGNPNNLNYFNEMTQRHEYPYGNPSRYDTDIANQNDFEEGSDENLYSYGNSGQFWSEGQQQQQDYRAPHYEYQGNDPWAQIYQYGQPQYGHSYPNSHYQYYDTQNEFPQQPYYQPNQYSYWSPYPNYYSNSFYGNPYYQPQGPWNYESAWPYQWAYQSYCNRYRYSYPRYMQPQERRNKESEFRDIMEMQKEYIRLMSRNNE